MRPTPRIIRGMFQNSSSFHSNGQRGAPPLSNPLFGRLVVLFRSSRTNVFVGWTCYYSLLHGRQRLVVDGNVTMRIAML